MPRRTFSIDVREFVGFVHRTGDLGGDGKFQAADRAVEGTRGHRRLQKSRGDDYTAEVTISYEVEREGVLCKISGRVDGLMAQTPPVVEEIKTVDRRWNGQPNPVHFAQLRAYAAILSQQREWPEVRLQLTYLDLDTDQTTIFQEHSTRALLTEFLDRTIDEWFSWLIPQAHWLDGRDLSLTTLPFPFPQPRKGQLALSRSLYRTIRDRGRLFVEAPTGLGKTMGALFPAVKALRLLEEGRIFYVTAKTPARQIAEEAIIRLQAAGAKIRSVNLTAKGKICFAETPAGCDLRTCPYAQGYYDRIKPALKELLAQPLMNRPAIEAVARKHQVCPFELSLDASEWAEIIIGDFNYVFDPTVRLQRYFSEGKAQHVVLVDEAHNLVDRSREMYSASLSLDDLTLEKGVVIGPGAATAKRALAQAREALSVFLAALDSSQSVLPARDYYEGALALADAPAELLAQFEQSAQKMEIFLAQQEPGQDLSGWLTPWFALQGFLRAAADFGPGYFTLCDPNYNAVKIFCADPRERLAETLKGLRATIFFSATLSPLDYFRDLLGGVSTDANQTYASPFSSEQMQLTIARYDVSFRGRAESLSTVAQAVHTHVQATPGNHLIFCPSKDYLLELERQLTGLGLELTTQGAIMTEEEREAFLARFIPGGRITALAVMGGIFAEGVDLPGDRLVGVTVIGVGLPRLSLERDILQSHFQATRGEGYDYAYRFPGMQRVIQAVGRLIRTEQDQGAALLIDQRFGEYRYRVLFPAWWPAGK